MMSRDRLMPVVAASVVGTMLVVLVGVMPVLGATYEPVNETGTVADTDHFAWVGQTPCGSTHANIKFEYLATAGFQGVAAWEFQANHPPGVVLGSTNGQWTTMSAGNIPRLQVIVPTWQSQSAAFHIYRTNNTGTFSIRNVRAWINYEEDAPECNPSTGEPTPTPRPRPTATPSAGAVPTPNPTATPVGNPTPGPDPTPTPPPELCWPEGGALGPALPCEEDEPPPPTHWDSNWGGVWECPDWANDTGTCRQNSTKGNPDNVTFNLYEDRTYTFVISVIEAGGTFSGFQWNGLVAAGSGLGATNDMVPCMWTSGFTAGDTDVASDNAFNDVGDTIIRTCTLDASTSGGGETIHNGTAVQLEFANPFGCCAGAETGVRVALHVNPDEDEDGDGFTNEEEIDAGTDPEDPDDSPDPEDSDGDGWSDDAEQSAGTDPNDPDDHPNDGDPNCGLPGVDDECVDYPGMSQGGGVYPSSGIGSAVEDCEPEYPKLGQLPLVTWVPPVAPDGWEPWEWIAFVAANVARLPDAFVNLFRGFWNLLVDLFIPSQCIAVAFQNMAAEIAVTPPFSLFVAIAETLLDAVGAAAAGPSIPALQIGGAEIELAPAFDSALAGANEFRGYVFAGIALVLGMGVYQRFRNLLKPRQMTLWGL